VARSRELSVKADGRVLKGAAAKESVAGREVAIKVDAKVFEMPRHWGKRVPLRGRVPTKQR